jgi:hypothetical protein
MPGTVKPGGFRSGKGRQTGWFVSPAENTHDPLRYPDHPCLTACDRSLFSSNREIWVMNADGGEKRQLTFDTSGGNDTPVESADGKHIAFSACTATTRRKYG